MRGMRNKLHHFDWMHANGTGRVIFYSDFVLRHPASARHSKAPRPALGTEAPEWRFYRNSVLIKVGVLLILEKVITLFLSWANT